MMNGWSHYSPLFIILMYESTWNWLNTLYTHACNLITHFHSFISPFAICIMHICGSTLHYYINGLKIFIKITRHIGMLKKVKKQVVLVWLSLLVYVTMLQCQREGCWWRVLSQFVAPVHNVMEGDHWLYCTVGPSVLKWQWLNWTTANSCTWTAWTWAMHGCCRGSPPGCPRTTTADLPSLRLCTVRQVWPPSRHTSTRCTVTQVEKWAITSYCALKCAITSYCTLKCTLRCGKYSLYSISGNGAAIELSIPVYACESWLCM